MPRIVAPDDADELDAPAVDATRAAVAEGALASTATPFGGHALRRVGDLVINTGRAAFGRITAAFPSFRIASPTGAAKRTVRFAVPPSRDAPATAAVPDWLRREAAEVPPLIRQRTDEAAVPDWLVRQAEAGPPTFRVRAPRRPPSRTHRSTALSWRTRLRDVIGGGDAARTGFQFEPCDVARLIRLDAPSDAQVLAPSSDRSSSDTVIVLGKLAYRLAPGAAPLRANDDVVLKLSFDALEADDDQNALVELDVYSRIIDPLLTQRITPHVIAYYGAFRCRNFSTALRAAVQQGSAWARRINDAVAKLRTPRARYDLQSALLLILERGVGVPLESRQMDRPSWLRASGATPRVHTAGEWRALLWQVLYTLEAFNRVGLRHNDLHLGNVWLDATDPATSPPFSYLIENDGGDVYYEVPSAPWLVKLYDFDHSYAPSVPHRVPDLQPRTGAWCLKTGVCNQPNQKFDAAVFLTSLYRHPLTPSDVKTTIRSWMSTDLLHRAWAFPNRPCRVVGTNAVKNTVVCDGDARIPDTQMLPVIDMLRSPYFAPFRRRGAPPLRSVDTLFHLPGVRLPASAARRGRFAE